MAMTLIKQQSQTKTVRCFQSHLKLEAIPREVTAHLQPVRVHLVVCCYSSIA